MVQTQQTRGVDRAFLSLGGVRMGRGDGDHGRNQSNLTGAAWLL